MKSQRDILKQRRKELNLTQENIAKTIGTSRAAYAHFELGNNGISIEHLVKLAKILNLSTDDILGISSLKSTSLTIEEWFIIDNWRKLSKIDQSWLMRLFNLYFEKTLGEDKK